MASKSVNVSDYRLELPGKLIYNNTIYAFPSIITNTTENSDDSNKRIWTVSVALYRTMHDAETAELIKLSKEDNEDKYASEYPANGLKIDNKYFDGDKLSDVVAKIVTKSGKINGKLMTNVVYVTKGKNIGKSNQTNVFTQALRDAYSKYNKHKTQEEHIVTRLETSSSTSSSISSKIVRYRPMLVQKEKDQAKPLNFSDGITVQYKYDGIHFIASYENGKVELYSRNLKNIPGFDDVKNDLLRLFLDNPTVRIDGEIYKHGKHLNEISGCVRSSDADCSDLVFYIFDSFIPCETKSDKCPHPNKENDQPYSERVEQTKNLYNTYLRNDPRFHLVENYPVNSMEEIDALFDKAVKEGYEGIIIRKNNKPYRYSVNGYHSNYLLKRKKFETEEFPIVNFTKGEKGIANDAIMWVCSNNYVGSKLKESQIKTFNVVPKNMSYDERYKLYDKYKKIEKNGKTYFENNIKGKLLTIEFAQFSKDFIPQQPLGLTIRDYE